MNNKTSAAPAANEPAAKAVSQDELNLLRSRNERLQLEDDAQAIVDQAAIRRAKAREARNGALLVGAGAGVVAVLGISIIVGTVMTVVNRDQETAAA